MNETAYIDPRGRQGRRARGAYYTPAPIAGYMARSILSFNPQTIVEPSFGDGVFLDQIAHELSTDGSCRHATPLVHGFELSRETFDSVSKRHEHRGIMRLENGDFVSSGAELCRSRSIDAVLGNPPFIAARNVSAAVVRARRMLASPSSTLSQLPGTANECARFLAVSIDMLRSGGSIALILPKTILYADYAETLRRTIEHVFDEVGIAHLAANTFAEEGAREHCIALLGHSLNTHDNKKAVIRDYILIHDASTCRVDRSTVRKIGNMEQALDGPLTTDRSRQSRTVSTSKYRRPSCADTQELRECARVRIGTVIGDKRRLVLRRSNMRNVGIPEADTIPILPGSKFIQFPVIREQDVSHWGENDQPIQLLSPDRDGNFLSANTHAYISGQEFQMRQMTSWMHRRPRWYQVELGDPPDAFIVPGTPSGPRLLWNAAGIHATNNFYGIWLTTPMAKASLAMAVLQWWFFNPVLSATGRIATMSQGLRKISVRTAQHSILPRLPHDPRLEVSVVDELERIDRVLRQNPYELAEKAAADLWSFVHSSSPRKPDEGKRRL